MGKKLAFLVSGCLQVLEERSPEGDWRVFRPWQATEEGLEAGDLWAEARSACGPQAQEGWEEKACGPGDQPQKSCLILGYHAWISKLSKMMHDCTRFRQVVNQNKLDHVIFNTLWFYRLAVKTEYIYPIKFFLWEINILTDMHLTLVQCLRRGVRNPRIVHSGLGRCVGRATWKPLLAKRHTRFSPLCTVNKISIGTIFYSTRHHLRLSGASFSVVIYVDGIQLVILWKRYGGCMPS